MTWGPPVKHCRYREGDAVGRVANNGYVNFVLLDWPRLAHQVIWLYMTGELPKGRIDHINGNRADNRWENLRDVSANVNAQNRQKADKDAKIPLLGVDSDRPGRYRAKIVVNGKAKYLGRFPTPEMAHEVYLNAKRALHPGCTI